jgi:arsenate reductase
MVPPAESLARRPTFEYSIIMEEKLAARRFGALAHASRLAVFRALARRGEHGLCAGDLAAETGLPPSTLSFHLHELTGAGLCAARRRGRQMRYAVEPEAVRELWWFVGEDCCQGRTELCPAPTARIADRLGDDAHAERRTVLFLCSHNAARSQIAEALLRQRAGERFLVLSAGMRPRPVHPMTLRVLREAGVPHDGLVAKDLGVLLGKQTVHHAIVLCPEAQQDCPRVAPFAQRVDYWPFPDPTGPARSPSEQLQHFRQVRDALQARLGTWLMEQHAAATAIPLATDPLASRRTP